MAAYVIVDIEVTDPEVYEEYKKLATPTVGAYGGKHLVRGGKVEKVEGDWTPKRFVILEFESVAQAKKWYDSQEYNPAKQMRHKSAISNMIIVEGT